MGRSVVWSKDRKLVWVSPPEIFALYGMDEFGRPNSNGEVYLPPGEWVKYVFLLWRVRQAAKGEEAKLVGVYATADAAEEAKQRVISKATSPDVSVAFRIDRHMIGHDSDPDA